MKIIFGILVLFISLQTKATHNNGGEITYKLIDSTIGRYKFSVTLYRSCAGIMLGMESLTVRSNNYSGSIPLTLISKSDVTPVCIVPDVSSPIVTNCPSGPIVNNVRGLEKWDFEATITLGKNMGWAYVGWTNCCRTNTITTGAANQNYWIQTNINTNYTNNSIIFKSEIFPYWCTGKLSSYNFGVEDMYDTKFITINNQKVLKDSIAYELIKPFQFESTSTSTALSLLNPSVTFTAPLTGQNFLYTTSGVTLDQTSGTISCTPSQEQDAVMCIAVKEYRAVPNANGIGYARVLISTVCRDVDVFVTSTCDQIQNSGLFMADSIVNSKTIMTCKSKNIQFKFKVVGAPNKPLKLYDNSYIDATNIANYSVNKTIVSSGIYDTMTVTVKFDKISNINKYSFLYKAYYCSSIGYKISYYIPINVIFKEGGSGFDIDTTFLCTGASSVRLNVPFSKNVSWKPQNNILNADVVDSSWVDVNPPTSQWYFANNLFSNSFCKFRDSIYVKIDTCYTVSGFLFADLNKDCIKNSTEPVIKNTLLKIRGIGTNFSNDIYTDNTGYYSFSPPANSTIEISSEENNFNCSTNINKFIVAISASSLQVNIPLKDSSHITRISSNLNLEKLCVYDSFSFNYDFHKTYGILKAVIYFGNGDSTIKYLDKLAGDYSLPINYSYKTGDTFRLYIKFYNSSNVLDTNYSLGKIETFSCFKGLIAMDLDTNCLYSSVVDSTISFNKVTVTDTTLSTSTTYFTDYLGNIVVYFNKNHGYKLKFQGVEKCPIALNTYFLPPMNNDTTIHKNILINPYLYNYYPTIAITGKINNIDKMYINVQTNIVNSIQKSYKLILPPKCKFDTCINVTNYSVSSNIVYFKSNLRPKIVLKFDSLVITDTPCFTLILNRVMQEADTTDNELTFCYPAFTSFDPNGKSSTIKSMQKNGDFTNKFDPIVYTINFQNIGKEVARDIYLEDQIEPKLDLNTLSIISSSHAMNTYLDDTRTLKFEFKNILLPSSKVDEPKSHGYVSFKINPDTSIKFNDIISNKVSIRFDFNDTINTPPVVNKYIQILIDTTKKDSVIVVDTTKKDSVMSIRYNLQNEYSVYPNPASDIVNIAVKNSLNTNFIVKVYSVDGKQMLYTENLTKINIRNWEKGMYLFYIILDGKISPFKILKE